MPRGWPRDPLCWDLACGPGYAAGVAASRGASVSAEVQAEIRRVFESKLERRRSGGSYAVPCAVKLGAATRS